MPLGMCEPCEKLYLFEADSTAASVSCPRCGGILARRTIRAMEDLPRFPFELVRREPLTVAARPLSSESSVSLPELCIR